MSANMISVDSAVCAGIEESIKNYAMKAIRELSTIYGFDYEEAISHLNIDTMEISKQKPTPSQPATTSKPKQPKAPKVKKPEIELPFCGSKLEGFCSAIKKSYGLYNQCTKPTKNTYCSVCQKQADKNSTNKPNLGDISDRIEQGENWSDPTGKKPVKYAKVMEKLEISKETAINVAESFGITIPEDEFTLDKAKKGRPKKSVSTEDTDDEKEKKKRGRPSKEKEQEEKTPGDDLIASLIEEAKQEEPDVKEEPEESKPKKKPSEKKPKKKPSEKKPKKKPSEKKPKKKASTKKENKKPVSQTTTTTTQPTQNEPQLEEAEGYHSELEEDQVIEVRKKEINGTLYLIDNDNIIYDDNHNDIGTYNDETGMISYHQDGSEEEV